MKANKELLDRAFPKLSSKYGAQHGRMSMVPSEKSEPVKLVVVRSTWIDYDYDHGGAYWGSANGQGVYCGYHPSGIHIYVRASTAAQAKELMLEQCPEGSIKF